eukprot:CFRG5988T1
MNRVLYSVFLLIGAYLVEAAPRAATSEDIVSSSNATNTLPSTDWLAVNNVTSISDVTDPFELTGVYTIYYFFDDTCGSAPAAIKSLPANGYPYVPPTQDRGSCIENLYCFINPEGEGCSIDHQLTFMINNMTHFQFIDESVTMPENEYTSDGGQDFGAECTRTTVYFAQCWYKVYLTPM